MQEKNMNDLLKKALAGEPVSTEKCSELEKQLSEKQKDTLHKAMTDSHFAEKLLQSPQAKEMFRKLQKGGGENKSE